MAFFISFIHSLMPRISVFTDCQDSNARSRQEIRYSVLLPKHDVSVYGVMSEREAAGCIVDAIDATLGLPSIIVGNVAPRGATHDENGCPFSFVWVGEVLVIGTPNIFGLLAKMKLVSSVTQTDVYTVTSKYLPEEEARRIANSQFRSYEYLPYLALWASGKREVPGEEVSIHPDKDAFAWFSDNFGNVKTSALEVKELAPRFQGLPFYERLTDVPKGESAVTRGSSGYHTKRFLEIVIQGGNAAAKHQIVVGHTV
jgi:hypothetical protein